jgi:integrase
MRKGEIMPRKWSEVAVDDEFPFIYTAKTKNGRPKRLPLPGLAVYALRQLPSYGKHEYLFPAKPNVRFNDVRSNSSQLAARRFHFNGSRPTPGITGALRC